MKSYVCDVTERSYNVLVSLRRIVVNDDIRKAVLMAFELMRGNTRNIHLIKLDVCVGVHHFDTPM